MKGECKESSYSQHWPTLCRIAIDPNRYISPPYGVKYGLVIALRVQIVGDTLPTTGGPTHSKTTEGKCHRVFKMLRLMIDLENS